jgi:hypothetical protein
MRAFLKLKKAASLVLDQIAKIQDFLTSMRLVLARDFQAFKLILKWYRDLHHLNTLASQRAESLK